MKLFILFILLSNVVTAATLQGTVYNDDLTIAQDAVVEINTVPSQRILATQGTYSFNIPPGKYELTVSDSKTQITEPITIAQNGTFTYDLFLFADFSEESSLYDDVITDFEEIPQDLQIQTVSIWPLIILILFIILALALPLLWLRKQFKHAKEQVIESEENLIVNILQRHDGKMTQKELRKHIPQSEAKISLMVAELEAQGTIKKIKKGRGNILILVS